MYDGKEKVLDIFLYVFLRYVASICIITAHSLFQCCKNHKKNLIHHLPGLKM